MAEEKPEKVDIRLILNGPIKDEFLAIKKALGITNNTDVLRLLIKDYHKKNLQKEAE